MILKPFDLTPPPAGNLRREAGHAAERQMAHYLHRDFAKDPHLFVLNNLRIVDPDQPELDGTPGVCQIDHLVMHRWGVFIVESKSVTDEVSIRPDGHGGDEWTRRFRGRDEGFESPIQQARRQGEFLRGLLNHHRESLRSRAPVGLRQVSKVLRGSEHGGYRTMPIQVLVAISDSGKIRRVNRWREAADPFCDFVVKADQVCDNIRAEFRRHKPAANPLKTPSDQYGLWQMSEDDLLRTAEFLVARHEAPLAPPAVVAPPSNSANTHTPATQSSSPPASPQCKACESADLDAMSGKYGYYWKCRACKVNTTMPLTCSVCGAKNLGASTVSIAQEGNAYYRKCSACGIDEKVWTQPIR